MNMMERVARAIWPNVYAAMDNDALTAIGGSEVLRVAKERACRQARAAIAAMRDPTEAMIEAAVMPDYGDDLPKTPRGQPTVGGMSVAKWHAMIDTALSEPEGMKE